MVRKFDASCVFCRCRRKRVSAGQAPGGLGLTATQVMLGALLGALGVAMGVLTLLPSAPAQAVLAAALIFSGCKLRADKGLAPAPPLACRDAPLLAPAGGASGGEESAARGGGGGGSSCARAPFSSPVPTPVREPITVAVQCAAAAPGLLMTYHGMMDRGGRACRLRLLTCLSSSYGRWSCGGAWWQA
eukprot:COSAG01_NODE_647_length_14531_cov_61.773489_15_plen_188_part_00